MDKTAQMRCIEAERGRSLQAIIREAIEAGQTWEDLALELGVTRFTLRDWTRKLGGRVEMKRSVRFASEETAR